MSGLGAHSGGKSCSLTTAQILRPVAVFLIAFYLGFSVATHADQEGDFIYESSTTEATITGYTGPGGSVTIRNSLSGLPVTGIGWSAFSNNNSVTDVTIGNSVTTIGERAFYDCSNLASITIPDTVTVIDSGTFSACASLTSVTIPDSVTRFGWYAFSDCISLTSVTIPDTVTLIRSYSFAGCSSLRVVYFKGDAPTFHYRPFDAADNVTICYLPGTSNWEPTIAGRPTALWIPVVPNLPLVTSAKPLRLVTSSPAPSSVGVQRSADLLAWDDWQTVTRDGGPSELQDTEVAATPYRFYRGVEE